MKLTRRFLATVFVGALVGTGSAVVAQTPASAGYIEVQQYNICGQDQDCPNEFGTAQMNLVWFWVNAAATLPWVVTLNEVCSLAQYNDFKSQMATKGYTGNFNTTKSIGGSCGSFGNAIFVLGTPSPTTPYVKQYNAQDGTPEVRKMMCLRVNSVLGYYAGCVTHLDNDYALQQSTEAQTYVTNTFGSIFRLVGGRDTSFWRPKQVAARTARVHLWQGRVPPVRCVQHPHHGPGRPGLRCPSQEEATDRVHGLGPLLKRVLRANFPRR